MSTMAKLPVETRAVPAMRIVGLRTTVVGAPWRELVFLELATDVGLVGLSELRMVNKTSTTVACIEELAPRWVLGTDPFDIARWTLPGMTLPDGSFVRGFAPALAGKLGVTPPRDQIEIAWHGKPKDAQDPFPTFSARTVVPDPAAGDIALADQANPDWAKGKVVLIGTVNSLKDRHRTPYASFYEVERGVQPGIVIHAHSLSQLLDHRPPDLIGWQGNLLIALGLATVGWLLGSTDLPMLVRIGISAAVVAALMWAGFELFY